MLSEGVDMIGAALSGDFSRSTSPETLSLAPDSAALGPRHWLPEKGMTDVSLFAYRVAPILMIYIDLIWFDLSSLFTIPYCFYYYYKGLRTDSNKTILFPVMEYILWKYCFFECSISLSVFFCLVMEMFFQNFLYFPQYGHYSSMWLLHACYSYIAFETSCSCANGLLMPGGGSKPCSQCCCKLGTPETSAVLELVPDMLCF